VSRSTSPPWPASREEDDLESTADLLAKAKTGDNRAQSELYDKFRSILMRLTHGRVPDKARDLKDTEELVQISLTKAFSHLESFKPERVGAFLAWRMPGDRSAAAVRYVYN